MLGRIDGEQDLNPSAAHFSDSKRTTVRGASAFGLWLTLVTVAWTAWRNMGKEVAILCTTCMYLWLHNALAEKALCTYTKLTILWPLLGYSHHIWEGQALASQASLKS